MEVIYMVNDKPGQEMAIRLEGTPQQIKTLREFATARGLREADKKTYERILRKANR